MNKIVKIFGFIAVFALIMINVFMSVDITKSDDLKLASLLKIPTVSAEVDYEYGNCVIVNGTLYYKGYIQKGVWCPLTFRTRQKCKKSSGMLCQADKQTDCDGNFIEVKCNLSD